ncbi:MAG TPA: hypothetical protein VFU21_15725 [Kofleriaceae bacterium]|nr:hypothetical protein [Kofleriaceae bacterium]
MRRAVIGLAVVGALAAAARAERLVLVSSDAELERATAAALAPWAVDVMVRPDREVGATMPQAAERAQALAAQNRARAVVWIASAQGRPSLWLYDVTTRKAVAIRLSSPPPFDPPAAAAIALAIKTLIRFSQVAPEAERYAPPKPPPARRLLLEARGGARLRPHAPVEPGFGLAGVLMPRALRPLGFSAGLRAGPGFEVESGSFVGHYDDLALAAAVRVALSLGGRLELVPSAGASVHLTRLRGSDLALGESAADRHLNPALDAGLQLGVDLGRPRLGLAAEAAIFARRQRFLVAGEEVYDVPLVAGDLSLTVGVPFW